MPPELPWRDLGAIGRVKLVAKDYFRGMSTRAIADKFGCPQSEIRKYIALIEDREKRMTNVDEFLSDVKQRTMEQIQANQAQIDLLWKELDWACERVPVIGVDGEPARERDPVTGRPTQTIMLEPRYFSAIPKLSKQITTLSENNAALLKLIGPKVDISVQLQMAVQTQTIVLDAVRSASPELYAQIYRQLNAVSTDEPQIALPGAEEAIDVEFTENTHADA